MAGIVDTMSTSNLRPFYGMWPQYNRRLREIIAAMSDDQLALRPAPDRWPIWATVGHTAGTRVYWLCAVLGEPGADATPFDPAAEEGWEDDLEHPRGAAELAGAVDTTFRIIEGCLDRWTPESLTENVERRYGEQVQIHTKGSILQRMFTHEAYHCGELSQTLGIAGLPQIDLWRPE
jgi:uncharacterized damage-inducible protein DinB